VSAAKHEHDNERPSRGKTKLRRQREVGHHDRRTTAAVKEGKRETFKAQALPLCAALGLQEGRACLFVVWVRRYSGDVRRIDVNRS